MSSCGREACAVIGCQHQPLTAEEKRDITSCACREWVLPRIDFPYQGHDLAACYGDLSANSREVGGEHYLTQAIQPWDYIHRNGIGFLAGSAIKYLSRYKSKDGVQDLEKAKHFLEKLIEEERNHAIKFQGTCGYALTAGDAPCSKPAGHGGVHSGNI